MSAVPYRRTSIRQLTKGIREAMEHGVLAGYPMVGLRATLLDGSYHDVDSNELSFKMAARLAYKAGIPQANPVLLEPYARSRSLSRIPTWAMLSAI